MKTEVKELHDRMLDAESELKAQQRQMRSETGTLAQRKRDSLAAQFLASQTARQAMRKGDALRRLEQYTKDRAAQVEEYPPAADKIRGELFHVMLYARKIAEAAGEKLPPLFDDWGNLAAQLDEIGRLYAEKGAGAAKFTRSKKLSYDFVITRAPAVSGQWTIEDAIRTIRQEPAESPTAQVLEAGLQWFRNNGAGPAQIGQIDNFLRRLYEERARQ